MRKIEILRRKRRARQAGTGTFLLLVILAGRAWPYLGFFIPLCMLAGLGIAVFRGRKWCDWLCPRGAFLDTALAPAGRGRRLPDFLRRLPFRLGALVLLAGMMSLQVAARWPDFRAVGLFFVNLLTATTALAVIAALFLHRRAWCLACPVGTLSALAGGRRRPLRFNPGLCVSCGLCARECPLQLVPHAGKEQGETTVRERDCLKCGLCAAACPKNALLPAGPENPVPGNGNCAAAGTGPTVPVSPPGKQERNNR